MKNLLFKTKVLWKDTPYVEELYRSDTLKLLSPITQVQVVPFIDKNHIVLYRHIDGYYGLPGGKVEIGEKLEAALRRECMEEINAELLNCQSIGYIKNWKEITPENVSYNARYVGLVKLNEGPVVDPAGKSLLREVIDVTDAVNLLHWGKKGEILIELALGKIDNIIKSANNMYST